MTKINGTVKFDQELWDARMEGNRADDVANPYLHSSSKWAAFEAGRAFGNGRISQARGLFMNMQTNHGNYRVSFDELASAQTRVMSISYVHGAR